MKRCGYQPNLTPLVPISALNGDNLIERSDKMPWYTGPTLLEALDGIKLPNLELKASKSLRIPLYDCYNIGGVGTVAVGRVMSGRIQTNMTLNFAPVQITAKVENIEMGG